MLSLQLGAVWLLRCGDKLLPVGCSTADVGLERLKRYSDEDTKVEVKAKELSGRERIKQCVIHGSVRHNACAMGLQPLLSV